MDRSEVLAAAGAAMAAGDGVGARALLDPVCSEPGDPTAHEMLAVLAFLDDDLETTRQQLEWAFRGARDVDPGRAALIAAELADLHVSSLGNLEVGQGWLRRAERTVAPLGRCVQKGWVGLAIVACEVGDVDERAGLAAEALEIAVEMGDHDLEVRALADLGYTRVVQGRTDEGFALLDEAMAALAAGEVVAPLAVGKTFCALLSAGDRGGDVRRVEAWTGLLERLVLGPAGGRPVVLHTHCRLAYGSVMCTSGRWSEGESALKEVLGPRGSSSHGHRADASCRLAAVWVEQGRIDEALDLLAPYDDLPRAAEPLARAHLLAGRPEVARAHARRGLGSVPGDLLADASLRAILVEVELARLDTAAATGHADALEALAASVRSRHVAALAALARGRVSAATGAMIVARDSLEEARRQLRAGERPLLAAAIALELALVYEEEGDVGGALVEADAALDIAELLQAGALADRVRALRRRLGVAGRAGARRPNEAVGSLTDREQQVLQLVREGLTNAEIGERLYISAKTAEHHVGRVLAKLGVRSRAEAAAVATAAALGDPSNPPGRRR